MQRQKNQFEDKEVEYKATIVEQSRNLQKVQGQLKDNQNLYEETVAEHDSLKKEFEESKERTKEDLTALRKDLREQLAYTQAIESEKKQNLAEIEDLKGKVLEVKEECTSALGVKEKVFNEHTQELRDRVEKLSADKTNEIEGMNAQLLDTKE